MLLINQVIGDRCGDRSFFNLSPLECPMNKGIPDAGDRLIEKMLFFYRRLFFVLSNTIIVLVLFHNNSISVFCAFDRPLP